jgi:bifunctional ADP-heptose synthase (sugar kinase/adenylyltransferase)
VDIVYIFQEEKPTIPVAEILPDFMIKWWDYKVEDIAWAKEVIENWWKVVLVPIIEWYSTTTIVNKIKGLIN